MAIEKDVVLIYFEDQPFSFARIEEILPDSKPNWYHVKLLMLQIPLQVVTWILRDVYIDGEEFTMNGKRMRLELVESPQVKQEDVGDGKSPADKSDAPDDTEGNVISFADLKKR
jgi:predicted FMN-binding regulatory protein PaiB